MPDTQILPLGNVSAPADYTIPNALSFTIGALFASYNGAAATRPYIPTVKIISDSGHTIASVPLNVAVAPGVNADATWAPGLTVESEFGVAAPESAKVISTASTNATSIAARPALLVGYFLGNDNSAARYVKLYDKASAPTVGTDVPKLTLRIPGASSANLEFRDPLPFTVGLALAMTTGVADSDAGAVAANEVSANLWFI